MRSSESTSLQNILLSLCGTNSCCAYKTSFPSNWSFLWGVVKCITSDRHSRFRPSNKHIQHSCHHDARKKINPSVIPDTFFILPTTCRLCLEPNSRSCTQHSNSSRNSRRCTYKISHRQVWKFDTAKIKRHIESLFRLEEECIFRSFDQ